MLVDLSHEVEAGMTTYGTLPGPVITDYLSREASRSLYGGDTEFQIGRIDMVANTGTYVDSPFHRFAGGADLAGLPLESLAHLPGLVVRKPWAKGRSIEPDLLGGLDLRGKAVLFHTGWDVHWRTARYGEGAPFLGRDAVHRLVAGGAALVGIDSYNVDDVGDLARPAHTLLLGAGVPVVEHLRGLDQLPAAGFRFFAVPPRVAGLGTFPVRAFAVVET